MNTLYKDGKKIIMRKIGFIALFLCILLGGSIFLWGRSAQSLLAGSQAFSEYVQYLYNTEENDTLNYAYIHTDIEMITGSYAQYGEVKEGINDDQVVYYLMPIHNGEFFVTVIGYGSMVNELDMMEESFYSSIGSEDKNYPDPIAIKGGFRHLNEEELAFALDYFKGYDDKIENVEDLAGIFSFYAISVNEIHGTSIAGLQMLWMLWIILVVLIVISFIVYRSKVMMYPLSKDMDELSAHLYDQIDQDYPKAQRYGQLYLGEQMVYVKTKISMHVYDYQRFIWLYYKERLSKKKRLFEVYAFDKEGKRYLLWQGEKEAHAYRICQLMMDRCDECLYGYHTSLFDFWCRYPKQLYQKCVELSLINEKYEPQGEKHKDRKHKYNKEKEQKGKKKHPQFKKQTEDIPQFRKRY